VRAGIGGFCLFRGERDDVARTIRRLREIRGAAHAPPLILASDLERGAGQQFAGLPELPPAGSFGRGGDVVDAYQAGRLTADGALAVGVNTVFAPMLDLRRDARAVILGPRCFGDDSIAVGRFGAAFARGCRDGHVAPVGKHFPGHGSVLEDSHATLPISDLDQATLECEDLKPFAAFAQAGGRAVMTAHVAFPALEPDGAERPASRSPAVHRLLRDTMAFPGVVFTDALLMAGAGEEAEAAIDSAAAGADWLLMPADVEAAIAALAAAHDGGRLDLNDGDARRRRFLANLATGPRAPAGDFAERSDEVARRVAERAARIDEGESTPDTDPQPGRLVLVEDGGTGRLAGLIAGRLESGWIPPPGVWAFVSTRVRAWKARAGLGESAVLGLRDAVAASGPVSGVLLAGPEELHADVSFDDSIARGIRRIHVLGDDPASLEAGFRALFPRSPRRSVAL